MDKKNAIVQLKEILPRITTFYKESKITLSQYNLITQLAERIEPSCSPEEAVKKATGIEVSSLWHLCRADGYRVIEALKTELEWMV